MRTGLNIDYINTRLNIKPNKYKIAIVLHVYYDEWTFFKKKLEHLNIDFDLYITLCKKNKAASFLSHMILKSFPSAKILKFSNQGRDIAPFLLVLKEIQNKNYNYLINLHTKKCESDSALDNHSREQLVDSLISSDRTIVKNIQILSEIDCISGTMFMVDLKAIDKLLRDKQINEWYSVILKGCHPDYTFTSATKSKLHQITTHHGLKTNKDNIIKQYKQKTLITFVHFQRLNDPIYEENLHFFIGLGLIDSPEYHFNFVINSKTGGECIPKGKNISVIKGHNKGYDFGAYKQSLDSVNLKNFDRFIFMNDTCRGPFIPNYVPKSMNWVEMFLHEIDDKVKLVGATWFNTNYHEFCQKALGLPEGFNTHVQSWCFGVDLTALNLLLKNKIFNTFDKIKSQLIAEHEIGMSQLLITKGYEVKPFQLSRSSNETHEDINHNNGYFGTCINPLETMFFKTRGSGKVNINNPKVLRLYSEWVIDEKNNLYFK